MAAEAAIELRPQLGIEAESEINMTGQCPKCHRDLLDTAAVECPFCGVIFSRFKAPEAAPEYAQPKENALRAANVALEEFGDHLEGLMEICIHNPTQALPEIQRIKQVFEDGGFLNFWGVHFLYFLAYGGFASHQYEATGEQFNSEIRFLCETSLCAFDEASMAARYEETETYQEEVTIKSGGFFQKPKKELQTKTRTVIKSQFDLELAAQPLDFVASLLEKNVAGRVHELLGFTKLKYLAAASRVLWAPVIQQAVDDGSMVEEDIRALGELQLKGKGAVRSAMVSWVGGGESGSTLLVALFDKVEPASGSDAECTGSAILKHQYGRWVQQTL